MLARSMSLAAASSVTSPLIDAKAEAARAAMQETAMQQEEATAAATALEVKAATREKAAAALEARPKHTQAIHAGERVLPTSDERSSHRFDTGPARKPARKASGVHPMFGALVAGIMPTTAARSLTPEQHTVRHARDARLKTVQRMKMSSMSSSSSDVNASDADTNNSTEANSGNGPPCTAWDKYNRRCYRSFADVVVAVCVFSSIVVGLCLGELYRLARSKLSKSNGTDDKGDEPNSKPVMSENRFPCLDHVKMLGVLMVIYNHFAMPSMTAINDASYFFPASGVFWGFSVDVDRPVSSSFKIPPWLDILLMAFPRNQMALLAFVSGFTCKSELNVKRYEGVLLIVLARTLYGGLLSKAESHSGYMSNFAVPEFYGGHLWYLYSLVIWRLAIQVFRPLYPAIGLLSALCISVFADRIFDDPHASAWRSDSWALKKSAGFFFAFAAGFYFPKEWMKRLRHAGVRGGALLLQFTIFFLLSQGSVVDWYYSNVSDLTELRLQNVQLTEKYAPEEQWQTRLLAVVLCAVQGFAAVGWVPHTQEWHTRYGAASLYPYVLHWHVLLFVLPHWGPAMLDLLPDDGARWTVAYTLILPLLVLLPLSSVLWRIFWWVILEPTWARIAFVGRLGKLRDAYEERGIVHAWQVAVDEFVPFGIKLTVPWMFGLWFTVVLALWVTMLMLFDTKAFMDCHDDNCKAGAKAYVSTIVNRDIKKVNNTVGAPNIWGLMQDILDPVAAAYDGGNGFTTRHGNGMFVPGGGAFATFITVFLFLGLASELCLQLMPMLHSTSARPRERV